MCIIVRVSEWVSEWVSTLRWRQNGRDSVSNHQPHDCLPNRLFRRRSKKTSKLRVSGLCAGNSPGTGEFPAQMSSYAENVSIWWRHHEVVEWVSVWVRSTVFPRCRGPYICRVSITYTLESVTYFTLIAIICRKTLIEWAEEIESCHRIWQPCMRFNAYKTYLIPWIEMKTHTAIKCNPNENWKDGIE